MERPRCSRPGHEDARVWFNGTYGKRGHERPRWKCVPRNGDPPHRFTEPLPRRLAHEGYCTDCERAFDRREGPASARSYAFTLKQVVDALQAVASGASYRQAAWRARSDAHRHPDDGRSAHGQLVADWVELFAPVIFASERPSRWPTKALLLDEQIFRVRSPDRRCGGYECFTILAAYGYEQKEQSIWRLEAHPPAREPHAATSAVTAEVWAGFLRSLPGCPERIVCDRGTALLAGVRRVWPQLEPYICEWHLMRHPAQLLHECGLDEAEQLVDALGQALHSKESFERFASLAADVRRRELDRWLSRERRFIEHQLERKLSEPVGLPHSVGALEERLRVIEQRLAWRAGRMTNQARLNRLLMLFQLELNGKADRSTWTRAIRDFLLANGGRPAGTRRAIADPRDAPSMQPSALAASAP
jgi:hypothetical protein